MAKSKKEVQVKESKRFVISKNMIGKGIVVRFTTKKGEVYDYDHDKVYEANKERFDNMNCFKKYKNYTSSNNVPTFAREFATKL